jgi:EAL domain-containing protein (putative c-di-GMP-specific phosphodiesterase class I)
VVADGVQSAHQADTLRGIGCDESQGFPFSEAMPGSALPAWTEALIAREEA